MSHYVSAHEAEIAPPLKYPQVEDISSTKPSFVHDDEEMESPRPTTITSERMQLDDCNETRFAIYHQLEASGTTFILGETLGLGDKTNSVDRFRGDVGT